MAIIKTKFPKQKISSIGIDVDTLDPWCTVGGNGIRCGCYGKQHEGFAGSLKKIYNVIQNSVLGYMPQRIESRV